jgi:septum site-determining protein MinC
MSIQDAPHEQPTPPKPPIAVKGRGDGLRITVTEEAPDALEESLRQQLERRASSFFSGASVSLEMPPGPLDLALAARLADVVTEAGMQIVAVTAAGAHGVGLPEPRAAAPAAPVAAEQNAPGDGALVVTSTVRSGQRLASDGSIVIVGDVNPGAEVIAGGSVVVWGRLRGIVEAGVAEGGDNALVCALDLAPTQLRIGPALARAPEEPEREPVPEVARQIDGRIVVDGWR